MQAGFVNRKPGKIEVTDQTEVSMLAKLTKDQLTADKTENVKFGSLIEIQTRHGTSSLDPRISRPISQRDINIRKSPRVNRSIVLKDELANAMRQNTAD